MILKSRGINCRVPKSRGIKGRGPIVNMGARLPKKKQLDGETAEDLLEAALYRSRTKSLLRTPPDPVQLRFGERVREVRQGRGLSQEALAHIYATLIGHMSVVLNGAKETLASSTFTRSPKDWGYP